jgi:predicted CoA-substrate-specific enzyme activase
MEALKLTIGLDIGSTTIKCVVVDEYNQIVFSHYERHYSQIAKIGAKLLTHIYKNVIKTKKAKLMISGSAGMGIADRCNIPFVQEVYATRVATKKVVPDCDVVIELGGEDAKIIFFNQGMEVRMNGSCAGGTGAFIDQMASLLHIPLEEFDGVAALGEKTYTIASRCGVFAKSDIQPLLNQGAKKTDIAISIFQAVVNQTIAGLAQGRLISGNVVYLGGPLTFMENLRKRFDLTLKTKGICPQNSLLFVALGAAYCATGEVDLEKTIQQFSKQGHSENIVFLPPLFSNDDEYQQFQERHNKQSITQAEFDPKHPQSYIGIDAGSTTIKVVALNEKMELFYSYYHSNSGSPVDSIKEILCEVYEKFPAIEVKGSAVTGYGEHLIEKAFSVDSGIVETVAHLKAAQYVCPDVEFVIDIGGQDIKCFKIHNKSVDSIYLNEACSSGCGSFLQTFSQSLGYDIKDFSKKGLYATHPVDLGSRCTVFMNSSVKQAQKEGVSVEDISAGLSISVVKNALYKVIRVSSSEHLGKYIVAQGGTFYNDAVLRSFELELGREVIRPSISGLMGAFGAALHSATLPIEKSSLISYEELKKFTHTVKNVNCGLCTNNCQLTINSFFPHGKYISGNRCERPLVKKQTIDELNIYQWKIDRLEKLKIYDTSEIDENTVGIPLGLNMYELIYFWQPFFASMGKKVVLSPPSTRQLYIKGQATITSDTLCFPAKLMHGHIQTLLDYGIKKIFYPVMTYNVEENRGDNRFNCPVVAYYPEVLNASIDQLKTVDFIHFPLDLERIGKYPKKLFTQLQHSFPTITLKEVKEGIAKGFEGYHTYLKELQSEGMAIIERAREEKKQIIVLAGRPYHADPEIHHGIDKLLTSLGCAVVSEDSIVLDDTKYPTNVLNQWTYHARLYQVAHYIPNHSDMNLVQLVSFGCGVDAITTDEVREILESHGKMYTQIKIDEITNLGAVKIRLRSLLSAIDSYEKRNA